MVASHGNTVGDAVNHDIFIIDVAGGTGHTEVILYRYELTHTVVPPNDTATFKLTKQVTLPLTGEAKVRCFMAANTGSVFIGTDRSTSAVEVAKDGFAMTSLAGGSGSATVSAITTDDRGFVLVSFGSGAATSGNFVIAPDGKEIQGGGDTLFAVPTMQGLSTKDLPTD